MKQPATPLAEMLQADAPAHDEACLKPFDSAPIQGDQRQSYRYPAQTGREEATIRRGGKTLPAKLVEESAGGIALEVAKDVKLVALEQIEVGIYSGWYVARVIHTRPAEKGIRVGLQRIVALSSGTSEPRSSRSGRSAGGGMGKFAMLFVGAAALLAGVGLTTFFGDFFGVGEKKKQVTIASTYAEKPQNHQLKQMLDSVNILTKPEIANKLRLTPEQRTTFDGVLVGASNRLGAAYEESKNAPPEVWYAKSQGIINDALENILCSMTDRQIVQWRRVLIEKRSAPPAEASAASENTSAAVAAAR
jgi:hypothetical protein